MQYYIKDTNIQHLLTSLAFAYGRGMGLFVFPAVAGFMVLTFKKNKSKNEWFILLTLLLYTPLLNVTDYSRSFALPILLLMAVFFIIWLFLRSKSKNAAITAFVCVIIVIACFSSLLQVWHPNIRGEAGYGTWYMNEHEYNTGLWVKEYGTSGTIFTNSKSGRVTAISGAPCLLWRCSPIGVVYGFFNEDELKMQPSPWYKMPKVLYQLNIYPAWPWFNLHKLNIESSNTNAIDMAPSTYGAKEIIDRFNITYAIEDNEFYGKYRYIMPSKFFQSMHKTESKVFDNGNVSVWTIKRT